MMIANDWTAIKEERTEERMGGVKKAVVITVAALCAVVLCVWGVKWYRAGKLNVYNLMSPFLIKVSGHSGAKKKAIMSKSEAVEYLKSVGAAEPERRVEVFDVIGVRFEDCKGLTEKVEVEVEVKAKIGGGKRNVSGPEIAKMLGERTGTKKIKNLIENPGDVGAQQMSADNKRYALYKSIVKKTEAVLPALLSVFSVLLTDTKDVVAEADKIKKLPQVGILPEDVPKAGSALKEKSAQGVVDKLFRECLLKRLREHHCKVRMVAVLLEGTIKSMGQELERREVKGDKYYKKADASAYHSAASSSLGAETQAAIKAYADKCRTCEPTVEESLEIVKMLDGIVKIIARLHAIANAIVHARVGRV